jgi:hypothetical protein
MTNKRLCPTCGAEVVLNPVHVFYGIRGTEVGVLAEGDLAIAVCCGVAILTEVEKAKEETSLIITPDQGIILP